MAGQVLVGADAERAFQEMTGQSSASAATTIAAKAALHDRGMATFEHPAAADKNTGGIPTKDAKGNILAPPPRPPATPPAQPAPPAAPTSDGIPEKFRDKSKEEVVRAYQELERKLGQPPQQQQQQPPTPEPVATGDDDPDPEAPILPAFASQEDEARFTDAVISAVGGQEVFESLAAWAPEYGDPVTVNAFNQAVNSGDANNALLAVKALRYEMTSRQGFTPTLVGGLALGSQSGPQPFGSEAERRAAMRDPRYMPGPMQDGAYVEEVCARIAASF